MAWALGRGGRGTVDRRSTKATPSEAAQPMAGDDLIIDPHFSNTKGIDLDVAPAQVFGWLTQMGLKRAGWYSYDWIDNFGRRSATEIHPEWQVTAAGEPVPAGPISFDTPVLDAPNAFVLSVLDRRLAGYAVDFTLGYELAARGPSGTRLTTRARGRIDGPGGPLVARYLLGPGDGVMVQRQLWGIAGRAR